MSDDPYFGRTQGALSSQWEGLEADLASRGTDWASLVASNPYKNITRKKTFWDKVANAFGMRSSYDKFMEEQQMNSQEYINNLTQKAYNEDYESPEAEAQRMRDAGMNPDLLGTEGVNGASPMPEESGIDPSAFETVSVQDVFSFISTGVSMAFGMAKDVQALKSGRLAIKSADAELASQMRDLTMQSILDLAPPESLRFDKTTGEMIDWTSDIDDSSIRKYGRNKGLRGQNLKTFQKSFANMMNGLSASDQKYELWYNHAQNKQNYVRKFGSEFYGYGADDAAMMVLNDGIIWLSDKIEDLRKNADLAGEEARMYENQNNSTYQAELQEMNVPEMQGQSTANEEKIRNYQSKVKEYINEMMDNILDQWKEMANEGDDWAVNLLYAFGMMKLANSVGSESGFGSITRGIGNLLDRVF